MAGLTVAPSPCYSINSNKKDCSVFVKLYVLCCALLSGDQQGGGGGSTVVPTNCYIIISNKKKGVFSLCNTIYSLLCFSKLRPWGGGAVIGGEGVPQ